MPALRYHWVVSIFFKLVNLIIAQDNFENLNPMKWVFEKRCHWWHDPGDDGGVAGGAAPAPPPRPLLPPPRHLQGPQVTPLLLLVFTNIWSSNLEVLNSSFNFSS